MKKIVVITGTSTGLGLESALLFGQKGYKVYATMRNLKKSDAIQKRIDSDKLDIEVLTLDVTNTQSVDNCINTIIKKEGKIDILVNNAGGGFAKTTEHATEEEIKWVTDLNYFGAVRCTKAVLPHMRKQKNGHIINISSVGGLVGQPFNELYCGAKFALEGFTEGLASYLTDYFGISFSIVEPGGIISEFMTSAVANTMSEGQMTLPEYQPILQRYMAGSQRRASEGTEQSYQTAAEVAQVILTTAESENPPLRVRTSTWAEEFTKLKTQADKDGTKLVNEVKEKFLK